MVIDKQKIEDEEDNDKLMKNHISNNTATNITTVIDDRLIAEVERYGFPKIYIVQSLNNDDLNYASTFYHLLTTQKEY